MNRAEAASNAVRMFERMTHLPQTLNLLAAVSLLQFNYLLTDSVPASAADRRGCREGAAAWSCR
jgi:hypothetical protein